MSAVLFTNQASLVAQKGLLGAQNSLANSVERLSSGLRINRAKDDAAGLGVGENLQKQLNGVKQGLNNVNDAISMAQTAEGALSAVAAITQRIITLATQGANDTMSQDQRASISQEIDKLRTSIQDIAKRTKYTDTTLFGSGTKYIQVSNNAQDRISIGPKALGEISVDLATAATLNATAVSISNGVAVITVDTVEGLSIGSKATQGNAASPTGTATVTAIDIAGKKVTVSIDSGTFTTGSLSMSAGTLASTKGGTLNAKIGSLLVAATIDSTKFTAIQDAAANYLVDITAQRGELGAIQNQLEFTVSNLTEYSNNLSASRSRVMDTDYASETANLTKGQILQQAATAMLAQANQMPNVILSLLKQN
jgi:flagellin